MVGTRGQKNAANDHLIPCGPDEIRMEDGTVRIMTETELLNRRIDEATEEVRCFFNFFFFRKQPVEIIPFLIYE